MTDKSVELSRAVTRALSEWLPWWVSQERRRTLMAPGMTAEIECSYYGRDFSVKEMALLRALIAGLSSLNRFALSNEFCRRIGWYKPDGGLKDMLARVAMLAMHRDGRIALPPPKWGRNPAVTGPDRRRFLNDARHRGCRRHWS